ncbi:MAG: hypothetical protein EBS19_06755 [Spirochaetia bacterium]|nr:hypothetical protein [Spirochaetia bacterium]
MKMQGYNVEDYENFSINEVSIMSANKQLDMFLEKKISDEFTTSSNKIYIFNVRLRKKYKLSLVEQNILKEIINAHKKS